MRSIWPMCGHSRDYLHMILNRLKVNKSKFCQTRHNIRYFQHICLHHWVKRNYDNNQRFLRSQHCLASTQDQWSRVVADLGEAKGPSPDMSPYARRLYIDIWQTKEITLQTFTCLGYQTDSRHCRPQTTEGSNLWIWWFRKHKKNGRLWRVNLPMNFPQTKQIGVPGKLLSLQSNIFPPHSALVYKSFHE